MGWDGMGWDGIGWDGTGWDRMGWDGTGTESQDSNTHPDRPSLISHISSVSLTPPLAISHHLSHSSHISLSHVSHTSVLSHISLTISHISLTHLSPSLTHLSHHPSSYHPSHLSQTSPTPYFPSRATTILTCREQRGRVTEASQAPPWHRPPLALPPYMPL